MADRLKITVDGEVYHATLLDIPLSNQILSICPFEADYQRSGSHEYYTMLPKKVSQNGCVGTTKVEKNRLYYFEGWNALSIVFADTNIEPYKVVYLGDIEEDMLPQMQAKGSRIHVVAEVDR